MMMIYPRLILGALSAPMPDELRLTYELVIYLALKDTRSMRATVYETIAQELRPVLCPGKAPGKSG